MTSSVSGLDLWVRPDEQCVALARGFRLIQRRKGHRHSVDDMLVAHLAAEGSPRAPRRVLDLGCGLGSVLSLVAWAFPEAELVGVEAQPEHLALARRNLSLNDLDDRARVVGGDLRDEALLASLGAFELVTGTPPYFVPGTGTICADPQRAAAQWELRGGIEAYAAAAASTLAPGGRFVVCGATEPPGRVQRAIASAGLSLQTIRPVCPREDKPPFLLLLTATSESESEAQELPPLWLRRLDGARTEEHAQIRRWTGLPASLR